MTISAGTRFGPYRILSLIGIGGMGEVYRAFDTRLEREVALKLISDSYLESELVAAGPYPRGTPHQRSRLSHERFLREARSAATLSNPHICAIYDTGDQDGRPYLVMELLRGETLKQYLHSQPKRTLPPQEVLTFSQQIASALAAAHQSGIIHRDIKPANLFVCEAPRGQKQIKVLDFGLAKRKGEAALPDSQTFITSASPAADPTATALPPLTGLTNPGSTIGTIAYMSPEQARGEPLDARTDLFSLGAVIHEMATGKAPFGGASTAEVFAALLREDPKPISRINPAMPGRLDPIVQKLLARDKNRRYSTAEQLLEDLDTLTTPTKPSRLLPSRRSLLISAAAALLVLVALAAAIFAWRKHGTSGTAASSNSPAPKESIIVTNFLNQTGDPVFDTTLNQALRIDLEQSPILDIATPAHLRQSVRYLGKPDGTIITPEIAREIGEREGMKAVLSGTIASLGHQYLVTLTAQNTNTGDEIASQQATASGKEHVLDALGTVATAMRARLGENLASIRKLNTPFGQATTPSLEAFRAYALGDEAHLRALDIPEAEGHYLRAIELDPGFAMAYARLGVIYGNSGQVAKAHQCFAKAYELSKNVSERERLYIAGHYYQEVTGDLRKGVETLQDAIQTYPNQLESYININVAYQLLGEFQQGLPYAQKAVELQPSSIASEGLLADYIALNRTTDVQQELQREKQLGLDKGTDILAVELVGYFLLNQPAEVERVVAQTSGHPDEFMLTQVLGATQLFAGQFHQAAETHQRAFVQAGRAHAPDGQAGILLQEDLGRALAGLCDGNQASIEQAFRLDQSKQTREAGAFAAAICGNSTYAMPVIQELARDNPDDTLIQDIFLPLSKAFIALSSGQPQQAVADAEPTRPYDSIYPGSYVQGLAYLQLRDAPHAIAALQAATHWRGGGIVLGGLGVPFYAESQLGLARAYSLAGNRPQARQAYQAFFTTWAHADPTLPLLQAARKEYAALQ